MNFGNWDNSIHENHDQIKRIATMQKIKPQNVSVNSKEKTAKIIGSSGIYNVTLNSCTCYDFETRQLPCKHIYRLAFELGFLDDLPKINRKASKAFKDNIQNEIERYKEYYLNGAISIEKFNKIVNALQSK
ncbi:SWIM zinc finger family protein [Tepidibacter thalassicus]|uniref:SWIM zinc finger n=1 Tax=Tepidibacter thalassicus DSM 15285 TaxID=1123350 RepID=A0A1M5NJB6_9FIRM|nr:SWIM zinc finger family protein [Tepidibacter thalassicus]SHG89602.1 SWIM zinc finger [Tepidibacter thalassicus DSM 15285]